LNTKISIVGAGYVGTSLGVLISSKYTVNLYDLDKHKVDLINKKQSHLEEKDISDWLTKKKLSISASTNPEEALKGADLYIICTPTNFDSKTNSFNTQSVTESIKKILKIKKKLKSL
jgi:UDPglucose 6-dehydrogenase